MIFVWITFLAAFLIEGLGTLVSVIGLSTLFGANPIIIALAVALDMGKLVVVSLLYTYWKQLGAIMKTYALMAATVTMIITSAGAAGYLSGEFQKAILGTQEIGLKVDVLKTEQAKLEERKKQIDAGIAAIPDRYTATQKIRLMNQFKDEQKQVTARLMEISKQLPEMQINQIGVEAKAGPILYVAKAFNVPVEVAVKYVILLIIFVFDPLAVFLIIAGNFLLHQRKVHKDESVADADLFADESKTLQQAETRPVFDHPPAVVATPIGSMELNHTTDGIASQSAIDSAVNSATMPEELRAPTPAPVEEPTAPIYEVLLPTPREPEVPPEAEEPSEPVEPVEPDPVPAPTIRSPEPTELITLDKLRGIARSSLNDVQPDDSITFDPNPRNTASRAQYMNYGQTR